MTLESTEAPVKTPSMGRFLLVIAFIAFISLGLPDGMLGVAWPSMSDSFQQPLSALSFAFIAGTTGYVTSTVLSGKLVAMIGIGRLLALSAFLTGSAVIGYTLMPEWFMVLPLMTVTGFGAGAIDAGINNYIAQNFRHMLYWLHAFFGVGVTIGPLIMTTALNVSTWRAGYIAVGIFQLFLAATFFTTAGMWEISDGEESEESHPSNGIQPGLRETIRIPAVWLSILLFLVYTGVEISVGQWSYTLFTEGRGVAENLAGLFVGVYWGSFTVGRVLGSFIVMRIPELLYLRLSMALAILGTFLVWWNPAEMVGLLGLPLAGFAFAPIFPALVGTTEGRVEKRHVANTIGFQIGAAGLGGAVVPGLAGALVRLTSLEAIAAVHIVAVFVLLALHEATLRK